MQLEIEGSPRVLFELFEAKEVSTGMVRDVPGGATIRYLPGSHIEKRSLGSIGPIFEFVINAAGNIANNLLSAWLYDKLKKSNVRTIRINRRIVELTPDGIQRAIEESIVVTEE